MTGLDPSQLRTSRKSHRKSRLGCLNCKRRHIKCNEVKPQCANCTNHSLVCDYSLKEGHSDSTKNSPCIRIPAAKPVEYTFVQSEYQDLSLSSSSPTPSLDTDLNQYDNRMQLQQEPPQYGAQFTLLDLKLQHQFLTSTCLTLAEDQGSLAFWQSLVPRVGHSSSFILHLSLALAGLHMKRFPHSDIPGPPDPNLENQIDHHYVSGLRALSHSLANLTPHTSHPVWIGSILLCFISMARGPRPGNYLFFSTSGTNDQPAEWISLLKGVQALSRLDELRSHINQQQPEQEQEHGDPDPGLDGFSISLPNSHSHFHSPSCACSNSYTQAIQSLRDLISTRCATNPLQKAKYLATFSFIHHTLTISGLDSRSPRCSCTPTTEPSNCSESPSTWPSPSPMPTPTSTPSTNSNPNQNLKLTFLIWTWTSLLADANGLDTLQRKEPIPLLLLAYFLVLFKQADGAWFARGWAEHILLGIEEVLDGNADAVARGLLRWPMEVILEGRNVL